MKLQNKSKIKQVLHGNDIQQAIPIKIEDNPFCVSKQLQLPDDTISLIEFNLAKLPGIFSFNNSYATKRVDA